MSIATLDITSELADGSYMHPTLPMSYLGEKITLDGNNYTATYTINFNTLGYYTDPFFILTYNGTTRFFYYYATGSGNTFSITFERGFTFMEGTYKFFFGESETGVITKPMFVEAYLYIGASRG